MNFNFNQKRPFFHLFFILASFFVIISSCSIYKKTDSRNIPTNAEERAKKNVKEGRGVSIQGILSNKSTNYEFSSSNPLWRATLDTLDFLPLTTVDYSGGVLITDWYNDDLNNNISFKITIRFLSNEINSNSLKISVHQKKCSTENKCITKLVKSKISEELNITILKKAAQIQIENKNKKK